MNKLILAILLLAFWHTSAQADLTGAWTLDGLPPDRLVVLVIVHRDDEQILIMASNFIELLGDFDPPAPIDVFVTSAILGTATKGAFGNDIGTASTVTEYTFNLVATVTIHRISETRMQLQLVDCRFVAGTDLTCAQVIPGYSNDPLSFTRVF